jgi:hypothetical protein
VSHECTYALNSIVEIWTRFEILEDEYIIVKLYKKNKLEKIELGLPIINFFDVLSLKGNWIQGLVGILKKNNS